MDWLINLSLDKYVTTFFSNNLLTIGVLLAALKAYAENSESEWDNKLADFFDSLFAAFTRRGNK